MAMSDDSNAKQLQELVTCAICLDYYNDPRILPCSHTFCFKCIQQIVTNDTVNCPMRDNMIINQNDIDKLPINRTAKDMVEFVLSINLSSGKKTYHPCDNCGENQAVNWCDKCATHYCESCTKSVHSIKALQSHSIVSLLEKIQSFCTDHPDEKFKYWCSQCEVLVCRDCLLFKHKDHLFLPLKDAATEAKTKFQETYQEIDEIKRNLTIFLDTTKDVTNQQREIAHQQKQDVEQTFATLQRILEERKCTIIKELEDKELETMNILDQQQNAIDQNLNLIIVQELCVKKMLDSNDTIQILKFKSTLSHNHKDFIEQYKKLDKGCTIMKHMFNKDDKDLEKISEMISKLGSISSQSLTVKREGYVAKQSSLNISRSTGDILLISKEVSYARGYKFSLHQPLKLRSIQILSNHVGQVIGFVVNEAGIIIQKGIVNPTDAKMKWLKIPLECDIKNNYTVLVLPPQDNGSYSHKNGDNQLRMINQNCSIESHYAWGFISPFNVGSKISTDKNIYSVDMILDIEE